MNARLSPDIDSVIQWVSGGLASVHFAMYIDREVMEQTDSYAEARDFLSTTPLMTGSYYILGGAHPGIYQCKFELSWSDEYSNG